MNKFLDPTLPYLSRKEAAQYLGISVGLLDLLAKTGTGPHRYKMGPPGRQGARVLYRRVDLDNWVTSQSQESKEGAEL